MQDVDGPTVLRANTAGKSQAQGTGLCWRKGNPIYQPKAQMTKLQKQQACLHGAELSVPMAHSPALLASASLLLHSPRSEKFVFGVVLRSLELSLHAFTYKWTY